jgi:hypothetical protein
MLDDSKLKPSKKPPPFYIKIIINLLTFLQISNIITLRNQKYPANIEISTKNSIKTY